jgi:hypothetical protein
MEHKQDQKMGDKTGLAQPKSYAGELADCGPEMSREHYMTESVLQGITGSGTTERLIDDAIHRPGILLYQDPGCQKRLIFQWSGPTQREVFEIRRLPLIGR